MKDIIYRQDALNAIMSDPPDAHYPDWYAHKIEVLPTVQFKEEELRPKGKWIDTGSGEECSLCHEIQYGYDSGRHYCANCGAYMAGGNK